MLRAMFARRTNLFQRRGNPNFANPQQWPKPRFFSLFQTASKLKNSGPPLLSHIPYAQDTYYFLKYATGFLLAAHIFVDYFYAMHMTYGPSMLPTLNAVGDTVFISKYYRHGRSIRVGDMVSFKHPIKEDVRVIKRVLGMPGDFVLRDTPGEGEGVMIQVPKGHCWVVGDNLSASRDSRMYGPLPLGLVKGKITWVWRSWFSLPERLHNTLEDVEDDY